MKKPASKTGTSRSKSRPDSPEKPKRTFKATDKRKSDSWSDEKPAFRRKPKTEGSFDDTKRAGKREWTNDKPGEKKSFSGDKKAPAKRSFGKRTDSADSGSFRKRDSFKRSDSEGTSERKPFRSKRDEFSSDKPEKRAFRSKERPGGDEKPGGFRKRDDFKRSDSEGSFKRSDSRSADKPKRTYTKRTDSGSSSSGESGGYKKIFRRDDAGRDESKRGGFKRSDSGWDETKRDGGFKRESNSFKKRSDASFDKTDKKPFRSREKDTDRFAGKDTNRKPAKAGVPFGAEDSQQTPPAYNLKKYENKKTKTRSKAKSKKQPGDASVRLNRYISNAGICSRRDADMLIASGEIKVNGKVVTEMGYQVQPGDTVKYGNRVLNREKMVYVLLNKPKDYITTLEDPDERKTVMELVKNAAQERIYPVGRLDRNTTGLLILTNDGELAEKLSHPSNQIQKLYEVELDRPITAADYQAIIDGVELEDGKATVDDLAIVSPDKKSIGIALHLGRNRIVRRIFEHLGYKVERLDRTTYAGLTKKDLPRGHWRYLTEQEVIRLKFFV